MAVAPDVSVFGKNQGFSDYQRANEEFQMKKQLAQAQAEYYGARSAGAAKGGNLPAALQVANALAAARGDGLPATENDILMAGKLTDHGLGIDANGNYTTLPGYASAVGTIEQGKQTGKNVSDLAYKPAIAGNEANAKNTSELNYKPKIEAATKTAESNAVADMSDKQALPIIDEITKYNQGSFDMPYASSTLGLSRLSPSEATQTKVTNTDLMKQARLDLAAPLAKQLGVNPTDKDFQASLDRIFNENASKASRQAQIDALGERIAARHAARNTPAQPVILSNDKAAAAADTLAPPKLGTISKGHAYIGGDPSKQSSWKAVK